MAQKTATKPMQKATEKPSPEVCVHHWIIEPPTEAVSKGVCRLCGAEKEFDNMLPSDAEWR